MVLQSHQASGLAGWQQRSFTPWRFACPSSDHFLLFGDLKPVKIFLMQPAKWPRAISNVRVGDARRSEIWAVCSEF